MSTCWRRTCVAASRSASACAASAAGSGSSRASAPARRTVAGSVSGPAGMPRQRGGSAAQRVRWVVSTPTAVSTAPNRAARDGPATSTGPASPTSRSGRSGRVTRRCAAPRAVQGPSGPVSSPVPSPDPALSRCSARSSTAPAWARRSATAESVPASPARPGSPWSALSRSASSWQVARAARHGLDDLGEVGRWAVVLGGARRRGPRRGRPGTGPAVRGRDRVHPRPPRPARTSGVTDTVRPAPDDAGARDRRQVNA